MERRTRYNRRTSERIKSVIENALLNRFRVRIWYGDAKTGKAWNEEHDVVGRIGRSTGRQPVPILLCTSRSAGGGAILDCCIIRIDHIANHYSLYRHKKFDAGIWTVEPSDLPEYAKNAVCNGGVHARFKNVGQAKRYCQFMTGERYNK